MASCPQERIKANRSVNILKKKSFIFTFVYIWLYISITLNDLNKFCQISTHSLINRYTFIYNIEHKSLIYTSLVCRLKSYTNRKC